MERPILAIVERAYRATLEEQYAHILWLTAALRRMQGDVSVLLRGTAVLYARRDQPRVSIRLGEIPVEHLPHYESAVRELIADGVRIYVFREDRARFRMEDGDLVDGVGEVDTAGLARLCALHGHVWYW